MNYDDIKKVRAVFAKRMNETTDFYIGAITQLARDLGDTLCGDSEKFLPRAPAAPASWHPVSRFVAVYHDYKLTVRTASPGKYEALINGSVLRNDGSIRLFDTVTEAMQAAEAKALEFADGE